MNLFACAPITGNSAYPELSGYVDFYEAATAGIWIEVEVTGLPNTTSPCGFYGMHIHQVGDCTQPFDKTGEHYNPKQLPHPCHAGDLPPLLSNDGYAFSFFYTNRLTPQEILHKSIIIHSLPDDFHTQPSGNAGEKIGCGVIRAC